MKLIKLPHGKLSSSYQLTIGKSYEQIGIMGCLVTIVTDNGETVSIHPSHFE